MSEQAQTQPAPEAPPAAVAQAAPAPTQAVAPPEQGDAAKDGAAPAEYAFSVPEGADLDEGAIAAFTEFARDAKLSQEHAQGLLAKLAQAAPARRDKLIEQARAQWQQDAHADQEIGGDKLDENLGIAKKALEQFGSKELRSLLDESGLGNHPEMIRVFYKIGKAISEDGFVAGRASQQAQPTLAQQMYPNMNP